MSPEQISPTAPIRVLVLELEPSQRKWHAKNLNGEGMVCDLADGIEDALEALIRGGYAVFVCSCEGQAGLELISAVCSGMPALPVIAVSRERDVEQAVAAMKAGAADYLVKPLQAKKLQAAILEAANRRARKAAAADEAVPVAADSAPLAEMRSAIEHLEHLRDLTLEALGDSLDLKDSETEGHSRRVTAYTMALARAMGLPDAEVLTIARGAYLHDIGKMAVPDAILLKSGPLTESEKSMMRTHCERGYSIIRKIPYLEDAAEIVYAHQERYDGSGYPRGLKGDEIPLGARIFAVADTLDAITSDRPYREANSMEYARREIERCAGTQLDPAVVEVFLKIPVSFWLQIREEILEQREKLR